MGLFSRIAGKVSSAINKGMSWLSGATSGAQNMSAQAGNSASNAMGVASQKFNGAMNAGQSKVQNFMTGVNGFIGRAQSGLNNMISAGQAKAQNFMTGVNNFIGGAQQSIGEKIALGQSKAQGFMANAQDVISQKMAEREEKKRQQAMVIEEVKGSLGMLWQSISQLPSEIKSSMASSVMGVQQRLNNAQEQMMSSFGGNSDILGRMGFARSQAEQDAPSAVA